MLTLFSAKNLKLSSKSITPIVTTPLGNILFDGCIDGKAFSVTESKVFQVETDANIHRWNTHKFETEVALVRPKSPRILQGRINDSWAGIWRLKSREELSTCMFSCRWQKGFTWKNGGADSGQFLDAQTFTDDHMQVTVGTEDSELIGIRADKNELMPRRLKPRDPYNFAQYVHDGFTISISNLYPGEVCQFQFLVAWAPESDDVGPSLAVDRKCKDILNDLGIV